MIQEPLIKRTFVYVDGQNLFHAAREAFQYTYPNFDVFRLVAEVTNPLKLNVPGINFYTGIHKKEVNHKWHEFWKNKLGPMGHNNIKVYTRPLQYVTEYIEQSDTSGKTVSIAKEKGIDIRVALDSFRAFRMNQCDVIIYFSQDQDLTEVVKDIKVLSKEQNRWFKIISAYPDSNFSSNHRGINGTDWVKIDKDTYDKCIDNRDYFPKSST